MMKQKIAQQFNNCVHRVSYIKYLTYWLLLVISKILVISLSRFELKLSL